jgi:hypothetical protein
MFNEENENLENFQFFVVEDFLTKKNLKDTLKNFLLKL